MSRRYFYLLMMVVALVSALVLIASGAWASGSVSIDNQVFRGDPGDVFQAGTVPAVAGEECAATLTYTNNKSQSNHPDTDILVGPLTFTDVEHGAFMSAGLTFTATGPVDVALRIGGDGVSSGGYLVEVTCETPTTTTTSTIPESSSTTLPDTTVSSTTTSSVPSVTTITEPPPVGGIDTGGGVMAAQVSGQDPAILLVFGAVLLGVGVLMAAWVIGRRLWELWMDGRRRAPYNAGADLDRPEWDD